jgi:hypothetical protein
MHFNSVYSGLFVLFSFLLLPFFCVYFLVAVFKSELFCSICSGRSTFCSISKVEKRAKVEAGVTCVKQHKQEEY